MTARPKAPSMKMYDSSTWSRFLLAFVSELPSSWTSKPITMPFDRVERPPTKISVSDCCDILFICETTAAALPRPLPEA
jgi:hypothetical protein